MITEKAVELGKALAESREIAELRIAEAEYALDHQAKKLYQDYRKMLEELEEVKVKAGGQAMHNGYMRQLEEETGRLKALAEQNSTVKRLIEAQQAADKLTSAVNSIINYYINGEEEVKTPAGCCGKCGRCS